MNNFRQELLQVLIKNNKAYKLIDKMLTDKAMNLAQNHCYNGRVKLIFTQKDIELLMKAKITSKLLEEFNDEAVEAVFCWQAKNCFKRSVNSTNKLLEEDKFYFYVPLNLLNVTDDALLFNPLD